MRVAVLATVEHSMFSGGVNSLSLATAEAFRLAGHDVEFIKVTDGSGAWWDDCKGLSGAWNVRALDDLIRGEQPATPPFDLCLECGPLHLAAFHRKFVARSCVWVTNHPFLHEETEQCLFPREQTAKRDVGGLSAIWLSELNNGPDDVQAAETLFRIPVRLMPYFWTPSIIAAYWKDIGEPTWTAGKREGWRVHCAETNANSTSSCILPLVILREAKGLGVPIERFVVHNGDAIGRHPFFRDNVLKHVQDTGLSGEFAGRQRCADWLYDPGSCVVSHIRLKRMRPVLLDLAWAGVPLVHNSDALAAVGCGLERGAYTNNHVREACAALQRLWDSPDISGALVTRRKALEGMFGPGRMTLQVAIAEALESLQLSVTVAPSTVEAPVATAAPTPAEPSPPPPTKFIVGFCDMWENFNPAYNFFTLALGAAGKRLSPPIQIVGQAATGQENIVVFGPFGHSWMSLPAKQPKIHFTGENTEPVGGPGVVLNLGFRHFDMVNSEYLRFPLWILSIDWFGADAEALCNPKPIPLERCTQVFPEELESKHKKFCAFVVSNPMNPVRNSAFQWLSEYKPVDSAGAVFNNMGPGLFAGAGGGGGELRKLEFLKDYKFCIAYENQAARGYTTEKYLHAKAAGCIPIYWGDDMFERDFSTAGCIDARNFTTPEELIEAVREVDENEELWRSKYMKPALDEYQVELARRKIGELARRLFIAGGVPETSPFPRFLGRKTGEVGDAAAVPPEAAKKAMEIPLMVTCVTKRFLPSLQHWLSALAIQQRHAPGLKALVFFGGDVPGDAINAMKEKYSFMTAEHLPEHQIPAEFPDFWKPEHYGWKLWIYRELSHRPELAGQMILYSDAGSFMCRWPKEWLLRAQATGLCFLEDQGQLNRSWCSPSFCEVVKPSQEELDSWQILGGIVAFRGGDVTAMQLFADAYRYGLNRKVLIGEKWLDTLAPNGSRGHRHDQSVLSIVSYRHGCSRMPMDKFYCHESLRKTFNSGRAFYVHRGDFHMHKPFAASIDEAHVINLDRREDRLSRLWTNSPELEGCIERWSAIDGRKLNLTPAIANLLRPNDFFWKKAVAGCALSHLGLWWKLAHDHPDIQNYLILEDDVKFKPGWKEKWEAAVHAGHIPEDYDVIYLGGILPPNREGFEAMCKERVNESISRIAVNNVFGQAPPNRYFHFCAYAYVLSKRGAQKVLELLKGAEGYWTSADHILCNPVNVIRTYFLDPLVAGCYQDDDPTYAAAQFNNFSRVDSFDSDLWNNDERFTLEEIGAALEAGAESRLAGLDIGTALADARRGDVAHSPSQPLTSPHAPSKPIRPFPRRILSIGDRKPEFNKLYEAEWLKELFGAPSMIELSRLEKDDPAPTDIPIILLMRGQFETVLPILHRWSDEGAMFSILHLADEFGTDPTEFYDLSGCISVLRTYMRPELAAHPKVTTIPLGYHFTLDSKGNDTLMVTPRLPFRQLDWSFFGTGWQERGRLLKPFTDISGVRARGCFFSSWDDARKQSREDYITTLLDTVAVPCPDGNHPETFRFYEALECGAVPIVVVSDRNRLWLEWLKEHLPLTLHTSWKEAADWLAGVKAHPETLESYREDLLKAWMAWKRELVQEVVQWLFEGIPTCNKEMQGSL